MRKKTVLLFVAIIVMATSLVLFLPQKQPVSTAFGKEILKVGAKGGDVYELQGRLKYIGYYTGKIDGAFGWRTYWAVRNFQYNFGMQVDGIVGAKTKLMLWNATKNWVPANKTMVETQQPISLSMFRTVHFPPKIFS